MKNVQIDNMYIKKETQNLCVSNTLSDFSLASYWLVLHIVERAVDVKQLVSLRVNVPYRDGN